MGVGRTLTRNAFTLAVPHAVAKATMRSHGWFDLLPFQFLAEQHVLRYDALIEGKPISLTMQAIAAGVTVEVHRGRLSQAVTVAKRVLGLDWDIDGFHRGLQRFPELHWIAAGGHGRFLRSACLFEDLIKTLLTTNTTWERTRKMNNSLVSFYGTRCNEFHTFPSPAVLAGESEKTIRETVGCGYRARCVIEIAQRALERPDVFMGSAWSALNAIHFRDLVITCPGIGPVSADYVCRVYGCSHGLAVDAYVRRRSAQVWGVPQERIEDHLSKKLRRYGTNGPLVLWLMITRQWHDTATISF